METEEQSEQDWHAVIETEEGCCSSLFSHKREIRPEEESVVVFSNESISVALLLAPEMATGE